MALKSNAYTSSHNGIRKGTSIGANPKSRATMNKSKKRSFKKYRGQGKWFITDYLQQLMEKVENILNGG